MDISARDNESEEFKDSLDVNEVREVEYALQNMGMFQPSFSQRDAIRLVEKSLRFLTNPDRVGQSADGLANSLFSYSKGDPLVFVDSLKEILKRDSTDNATADILDNDILEKKVN